jgi:hypothetical protein
VRLGVPSLPAAHSRGTAVSGFWVVFAVRVAWKKRIGAMFGLAKTTVFLYSVCVSGKGEIACSN